MFSFPTGSAIFFYAGLAAAAGPVLIHLLNRRRFRVVHWAAMDLLLEALRRNRRILQLRDVLLLALRTACIVLFGLALAQPMWSSGRAGLASPNEALHAILVLDNSLSMGYEKLDGTLLDEAKARAAQFVDDLPESSRVSVLPLCGSAAAVAHDAYRSKQEARDAIQRIELVDRAGTAAQAVDLALEAARRMSGLPNRVVFFGDQQLANWPADTSGGQFSQLDEMQVVSVAPQAAENTWIERFNLQDGITDVESQAVLVAVVRHEGPAPRTRVPVTLSIDGAEVQSVLVDLEPGQSREVVFKHRFEVAADPDRPLFVPASVSIPPDKLPGDDSRSLAVPVVAALPVVVVDQYGSDENPARMRYGETRHLRRLLSPVTTRGPSAKPLVTLHHKRFDQLTQDLLKTARLVIIAGVTSPDSQTEVGGSIVSLLAEYVRQGGQLVVAAGAQFDAAAWNRAAWLDGAGILPVPLKPEPIGQTPDEASDRLRPFQLSFASMSHDLFQLADTPREELEDLYSLPVFFKAVEADAAASVGDELVTVETQRIERRRQALAKIDGQLRRFAELESKGALAATDRATRDEAQLRRRSVEPDWLAWRPADAQRIDEQQTPRQAAELTRPRVLARFDNRAPFLVERAIGNGSVLLVTSGTFSPWNNLPKTNAVLMFDRILRGMLERTLPRRNLSTSEQLTLPVADRSASYTLARPDGHAETLSVDALGADRYGVTARNLTQRGIYRLAARQPEPSSAEGSGAKLWVTALAVNGPPGESEPAYLDAASFQARVGKAPLRWVARGEAISLEGGSVRGRELWKWLLLAVLACLALEMIVLGRPALARERTA